MLCAKCHNENLADAVFCAECGVSLDPVCPSCAVANAPGSKFCRKCGFRFMSDAVSARNTDSTQSNKSIAITVLAEPESIPQGERKTVTALFADIKGSTELMADLDPEEARAIIDPALKLMIDAVHRYDGYVVPTASSRCSARRSPTRTIRRGRSMRRCACRKSCAGTLRRWWRMAGCRSKRASGSTRVRW
jgi:double zinc ribbon protein